MSALLTAADDPIALADSWTTPTNSEHCRTRLDCKTTPPLEGEEGSEEDSL